MPLSPLLRDVADRLVTALMVVANALEPCIKTNSNAAGILLAYLSELVIRLIDIDNFGIPQPTAQPAKNPANPTAMPATTDQRIDPRSISRPRSRPGISHRRGWIIATLPAIEPSLADLRALLTDPALAALLEADPALLRLLSPLLRSLDLTLKTSAPPVPAKPAPARPGQSQPLAQSATPRPEPGHVSPTNPKSHPHSTA